MIGILNQAGEVIALLTVEEFLARDVEAQHE